MNCKTCNQPLNFDQEHTGFCSTKCIESFSLNEAIQQEKEELQDKQITRYPALHLISKIFKFFAFLSGCVGVIFLIGGLAEASFILFIYGILSLTLGVVINWAISESILLFIDIESHTRKTQELLAEQRAEPNTRHNG